MQLEEPQEHNDNFKLTSSSKVNKSPKQTLHKTIDSERHLLNTEKSKNDIDDKERFNAERRKRSKALKEEIKNYDILSWLSDNKGLLLISLGVFLLIILRKKPVPPPVKIKSFF